MSANKIHFDATVGNIVRQRREALGLSRRQIANSVPPLTETIVHNIEEGRGTTAFNIALLAEALDCTCDDLCPLDAMSVAS